METDAVSGARSVPQLVAALSAGRRARYVFFWSHVPRHEGVLDHACLSQWFPVTFTRSGETFHSAEQYMMWRKAQLFQDRVKASEIISARSPAQAKALGRQVTGFDDGLWNEHRWDIVVDASEAKFRTRSDLQGYLLASRDRVLVEASPRDRIWGIGLAADSGDARTPAKWRGLNLLGFALMEARERIASSR